MATSDIQICSNGLLLLGADPINSFDDESDRATLVSNLWPNMRDAVLRQYPWNCAVKRLALAADVATPAFEYGQQFSLPGDCLRILSIGEEGDQLRYAIEGSKLLCDESVVYLRYLFRNTDATTYDSLLVETMEAYVAMTCAYPITRDRGVQKAMSELYSFKLRQARTVDSQEQPAESFGDFPFLQARY